MIKLLNILLLIVVCFLCFFFVIICFNIVLYQMLYNVYIKNI